MRTSQRPRGMEAHGLIVDTARIECIFRGLARANAIGMVFHEAPTSDLIAAVATTHESHTSLRWSYNGPSWGGTKTVDIAGPLSLYRFGLEFGEHVDGRLDTPIPDRIERVRCRGEARVRAPSDVGLSFRMTDGRFAIRGVSNLSRGGLSFVVGARDAISVGDVIPNVSIVWQGRLRICGRLLVHHVSEKIDDGRTIAGATIEFDLDEDRDHYESEVDTLVNDRVRTGGTWTRDMWELYEKSGYFSLSYKSPADFMGLSQAFGIASRKLATAPALGLQVVWPSARGIEAASAAVAMNSQSVFLYHVARRRGNPPPGVTARDVLYAVYDRALRWIRSRPSARWLVVWIQDSGRFPKRLHVDFANSHCDDTSTSVVSFRALEISTSPTTREEPNSQTCLAVHKQRSDTQNDGWSVRRADAADLVVIATAARALYPQSFVAAYGLVLPFESDWTAWDSAGLRRGREIVVAECEGRVEAAAIVEHGEDGVHLFGLFDVVRIVPIGRLSEGAVSALLAYAKTVFARLGKTSFLFANDPAVPRERWPEGAIDRALIHCTVISLQLLPEFRDHLWELTLGAPD